MHCDIENAKNDLLAAKANLNDCTHIAGVKEMLHFIDAALLALEEATSPETCESTSQSLKHTDAP